MSYGDTKMYRYTKDETMMIVEDLLGKMTSTSSRR